MKPLVSQLRGAQREVPFVLRVGDKLVRGTIDLVLPDGTIVDYKTGHWSAEKHAGYERQVRLYAAAVRTLLGRTPPTAYLCYLDADADEWVRAVDVSAPRIQEVLEETAQTLDSLPDQLLDASP